MGTYDWKRFDAEMRERAKALSCLQLVSDMGLAPAGRTHQAMISCPTPEHDDTNPSCSVRQERWKCFGCGASGDVLDLVGHLFDLSTYDEKLHKALELQGIDYEQERVAFMAGSSRRVRSMTTSTPRSQNASPSRPLQGKPRMRPHPEEVEVLLSLLSRLELDDQALAYLEARGIPRTLARSHGLVSATYEHWRAEVERVREVFSEHALEHMGLLSEKGRAHPFVEHLLVFPYMGPEGPTGLRFRRLSQDETYQGARYLGRRHGHNQARMPYLGSQTGWPGGLALRHGLIWVVEGEFDALSLRSLGRASLGVPGAQVFESGWVRSWSRARGVVLVRDADEEGVSASDDFARSVREACEREHGSAWTRANLHVEVVHGAKDANELLVHGELEAWVVGVEERIAST